MIDYIVPIEIDSELSLCIWISERTLIVKKSFLTMGGEIHKAKAFDLAYSPFYSSQNKCVKLKSKYTYIYKQTQLIN